MDLGTGTGCLLLALLHEYPAAFGVGVDIAPDAARLARLNALQLGLADRAGFVVGDWTNAIRGRFDLVISNPPYIPAADISGLMPEVALHEPRRALDGGADGYEAYRTILSDLPDRLLPAAPRSWNSAPARRSKSPRSFGRPVSLPHFTSIWPESSAPSSFHGQVIEKTVWHSRNSGVR